MRTFKIFFVQFLLIFCVSNLYAQKIITGPKKKVTTEQSTVKQVSKTPTGLNRESSRKKEKVGNNRSSRRTNGSSRVDYSRYNDGLVHAAENGDVKACHCLGHLYDKQYGYNGVIPDEEMAIKWYTLAADKGDFCAQIDLVFHCLDWPKKSIALEKVKQYAESGNVCMQSSLGSYYMNKFNYQDAIRWLRLAANNENAQDESYNDNGYPAQVEAWYMLGKCCFEGLGVEKDASQGRRWMKKAANAGLQEATNYLDEH